ncbi:branched-chain amino acid ABC transporter permease [Alteromonas sp. P256]|uniref:branched-chain amino acid ABC transporter permease n=1 Tax=Alteromonas sp. P256 TaxID=3117399 RepID=UPI002FE2034A
MTDAVKLKVSNNKDTTKLPILLIVFAISATCFVCLPLFLSRSSIQELFQLFVLMTLAFHWNILAGYAGLMSVGQQAFVGLGAYIVFVLAIHTDVNVIAAIVIAAVGVAAAAVAFSQFVFRLTGPYFAIGTWVVAEVCRLTIIQFQLFGSGTGLSLPRRYMSDFPGVSYVKELLSLKTSAAIDIVIYWVAVLLFLFTVLAIVKITYSRIGLALRAIKDNEQAAESIGINIVSLKRWIYVGASTGFGLIGAIFFLSVGRVSPDVAFSLLDWTGIIIFIVVIGGIGTLDGPVWGTITYWLLSNVMSGYGSWYLIVLGVLGIGIMLFKPTGIAGIFRDNLNIDVDAMLKKQLNKRHLSKSHNRANQ